MPFVVLKLISLNIRSIIQTDLDPKNRPQLEINSMNKTFLKSKTQLVSGYVSETQKQAGLKV